MFALFPFAFPSISVPTGASSNFSDLPLETLDVSDGWTQAIRGTVSVTASSYDANGVGTYTFSTGSSNDDTFPIWHQQAYARDSAGEKTLLTTSDTFLVRARISQVAEPDFPLQHALCLTDNPTGTFSRYRPMGAGVNRAPSDADQFMFVKAALGKTFFGTESVNKTIDYTIFHVGGASPRRTRVIGHITDASGDYLDQETRADASTVETASQAIYLAFHFKPFSADTPIAGEQTSLLVQFRCIKFGA